MTETRTISDAVAATLLAAVSEGSISAGVAVDIARRVSDQAQQRGVEPDSLLELSGLASRL